jgi:FMN phosphatase YigB (HAD superfamily)
MIRCIIFDLSEVLIAGLVGIEKVLSNELPIPEEEILPCFGGAPFEELLVGNISEDTYLRHIAAREKWDVSVARLKAVIRDNFHHEVEGSLSILTGLASRYRLALLSDHAREWIAYIQSIHPFLKIFQHTFFSYELKKTKRDPASFLQVLDAMSLAPRDCLFIDDSPTNVHIAESVGIPSIRFVNAERLAHELGKRQEGLADAETACTG